MVYEALIRKAATADVQVRNVRFEGHTAPLLVASILRFGSTGDAVAAGDFVVDHLGASLRKLAQH